MVAQAATGTTPTRLRRAGRGCRRLLCGPFGRWGCALGICCQLGVDSVLRVVDLDVVAKCGANGIELGVHGALLGKRRVELAVGSLEGSAIRSEKCPVAAVGNETENGGVRWDRVDAGHNRNGDVRGELGGSRVDSIGLGFIDENLKACGLRGQGVVAEKLRVATLDDAGLGRHEGIDTVFDEDAAVKGLGCLDLGACRGDHDRFGDR